MSSEKVPCGNQSCPNTGRYMPSVHVYFVEHGKSRPNPIPVEIEFPHMRLCRACKKIPETVIQSLWPEIKKQLFARGMDPSNHIRPFVHFHSRRYPE